MPIYTLPKVDKDGVLAIHSTPQNRLGEYFCDNDNNRLWVYLRADAALTKGAALASKSAQSITSGLLQADAGSNKLNFGTSTNLDTTFPRVPNQPQFSEYMVVQEVGGDQLGVVYEHRKTEASVQWFSEDNLKLTTQLAANADLSFFTPWLVGEAGTTSAVLGFAQKAIAQGEYFWALVEGIGWGIPDGAITAGAALRVSNTSGELDDTALAVASSAVATTTAPCAYAMNAAAADQLVSIVAAAPARIGIPPFQGTRTEISYDHPSAT